MGVLPGLGKAAIVPVDGAMVEPISTSSISIHSSFSLTSDPHSWSRPALLG